MKPRGPLHRLGLSPEERRANICQECGGHLGLSTGPERYEMVGMESVLLPDDFNFKKCNLCQTKIVTEKQVAQLMDLVKAKGVLPYRASAEGEGDIEAALEAANRFPKEPKGWRITAKGIIQYGLQAVATNRPLRDIEHALLYDRDMIDEKGKLTEYGQEIWSRQAVDLDKRGL